jgi:signal transduction histidine kinase
VQELVAAQQGTVRVESEPGRGTTVAVSLQAVHT